METYNDKPIKQSYRAAERLYAYQGCDFTSALQKLRASFKQCPKSLTRKSPETMEQEMFISRYTDFVNGLKRKESSVKEIEKLKEMNKEVPERDRVRGSLVAGAIGDALGYAVEFDSYAAFTQDEKGRYWLRITHDDSAYDDLLLVGS